MPRRLLHQTLHRPRLRAVLPLTDDSRLVCPLGENARSSLVAVGDADLEGVVVESSNQNTSTTIEFLLKDLK